MNRIKALNDIEIPECRILLIDNNSPFVLPLLRSFSGYPHVKVDLLLVTESKPRNVRYSRFLKRLIQIPYLADQKIVQILKEIVNGSGIDVVIPTREWISALLYHHREALEEFVLLHPVPDESTLEITCNKWTLNQWLKENDFPFSVTSRLREGWSGAYPLLLKPVSGIGGQGIQKINVPDQFQTILNENLAEEKYFLQEYIHGFDIDISLFAIEGKIIYHTIQKAVIPGSLCYSKAIQFVKDDTLLDLVSTLISRLRFHGIAHLDFRFDTRERKYILIDFNARYWSSLHGSSAMGINFPYLVVAWIFGKRLGNPDYRTGYYYFTSSAFKTIYKNLLSKKKVPVRLKDTQLYFLYRDPLPELIFLFEQILAPVRRKSRNPCQ